MAAAMHATSACPRTPLPRCPSRSGSLTRPAARMIGVASRKAKRAESLWSRPRARPGAHRDAVAADARDQGGRLGRPDDKRLAVLQRVELAPALGVQPLARRQFAHRGAAAEALGGEQHEAVDHQEDGGDFRLGGERAQLVLQCQPDDPRGNTRDDDQPRQSLVGSLGAALAQRRKERLDDFHPRRSSNRRAVRGRCRRAASRRTPARTTPIRTGRRPACSSRTASGRARCGRGSRSGTARSRPAARRARSPGSS